MPGKFKINNNQLKKKRKSKKHLFPEKQLYFFHLYIRAQTVSLSSEFCGGMERRKAHIQEQKHVFKHQQNIFIFSIS
jgi:hypothetical protein